MAATAKTWPEPYLQPDRMKDCGYYAQAYLCRCLGHPGVTAGQVRAWRAETRIHETMYARNVLGAQVFSHIDGHRIGERAGRIFFLGPSNLARLWVRRHLERGWIAHCQVHRIQPMGHAVVLLGASNDGVLLMDPICGHVTEPWEWFLGPGPAGAGGCHFIEGWYKPAKAAQ